jgi:PhnB protein
MSVKPIPEGYSTVTPYLVVDQAAQAIDFYKRAFGAEETVRMAGPMGKIMHAELKIGNSMIMLGDEMPGTGARSPHSLGGTSSGIMLYVNDADATFAQAVSAGAKVETPLANMFWGDRYGKLTDPFGHSWSVATHIEDVAPADMKRRMEEAMAQMGQARKSAT